MTGLVPVEHWDYGVADVVGGLSAAIRKGIPSDTIRIPGIGDCIPARSGRAGLVAAIRALDLPAGSQIGVPLYCCPVVFKAIREAGCTTRFIDVDEATYCLSAADLRAKREGIVAVIAVHMFGNVCDMASVREAAQSRPIIEDCAQSLGSRLGDRPTGTFGVIGVFSFRSGKYLSVGEGGALFTDHPPVHERLRQITAVLPAPDAAEESVHVAVTYVRSKLRSRPFYGIIGHRLWKAYNQRVPFTSKSPIVLSQMYRSDLAITRRRLADLGSRIEAQRARADLYSRALMLEPEMLCAEPQGAFYNRYLYPIRFSSSQQRDNMAMQLERRHIGTAKPYSEIVEIAAQHYDYSGDCPAAERIAGGVLVLPSYHALSCADVSRIAQCVNEEWQRT